MYRDPRDIIEDTVISTLIDFVEKEHGLSRFDWDWDAKNKEAKVIFLRAYKYFKQFEIWKKEYEKNIEYIEYRDFVVHAKREDVLLNHVHAVCGVYEYLWT